MRTTQKKCDEAMLFTKGGDWHLDIFIEPNAQIISIYLKAYSHAMPHNIYSITYFGVRQEGNQTQIPIDVARIGHSIPAEEVHLLYELTYAY